MARRVTALLLGLMVVFSGMPAGAAGPVEAAMAPTDVPAAVDLSLDAGPVPTEVPSVRSWDYRPAFGDGHRAWVGAARSEFSRAADSVLALVRSFVFFFYNPAVADTTVTIDPGQVTTLTDGLGAAEDVVIVGGYAYVADTTAIWKVELSTGSASVFAGSASTAGCVDDIDPGVARFNSLTSITTDGSSLFVLDDCPSGSYAPNSIREVDLSSGGVSTLVSFSKALNDVVYAPDDFLYVIADPRDIIQVDPSDGSNSLFVTHPYDDETLGQTWDLTAITADSSYLYVVAGQNGSATDHINKVALADAAITPVAEAAFIGRSLESAGDYLYASADFSSSVPGVRLNRYTKSDGSWSTVVGSGSSGEVDGVEVEAWFGEIGGIASDGTSIWVADAGNSSLRKVVDAPSVEREQQPQLNSTLAIDKGRVTTMAGSGSQATTDGTGTAASFNQPRGVVVVGDTAYVAQPDAIRAIDLATGAVTTFAGTPGTTGCVDSTDPEQTTLVVKRGLVTDGAYLYTLNQCQGSYSDQTLRRTSLATGATTSIAKVLYGARDLAFGPDGLIYVVATLTRIDSVDPVTGAVVEDAVATGYYYGANIWVEGITADASGLWVIADPASPGPPDQIDHIGLPDGTRTTVGTGDYLGDSITSVGDYVYVSSSSRSAVVRFSKSDGSMTHVAGPAYPYSSTGYVDGLGTKARFAKIQAMASDGIRILVADETNHRIRSVADDGFFSYGAGSFGWDGYAGWFGGVNTGLGGYVTSQIDVSVATVGPALEVSRTYNSADPGVGAFGRGWTFSYDIRWVEDDVGNIGVLFPDGRREIHTKSGSTYVPPEGYQSTLTGSPTAGFTLTLKDGTEIDLGSDGRVTSITDRNGRELTFTYNGSGELTTATSESGRTLSFTWSGGHITEVSTQSVSAHGGALTWKYYYSGDLLTDVCDPRDNAQTGSCVEYDYTLDLLTEITRPEGNRQVGITYRADRRVQTTIDGLGNSTGYAYPEVGVTEVTDPRGNKTTQEFDDSFRLISETDPASGETTYTYSDGNRVTITDPLDHTSTLGYDSRANVTSIQNPEGETSYFTYNSSDDLTESRDGRSSGPTDNTYRTVFTYDAAGNRLSETDPLGNKTTWTYTDGTEIAVGGGLMPAGLVETMVSPPGNEAGANPALYTTSYAYDSEGDLRTVTYPSGLEVSYTHDELGRTLTETVTDSVAGTTATTTYTYDQLGNQLTVTGPAIENPVTEITHQQRVTNTFDGNSRLTQSVVSDLQGGDTSRTTQFGYDLNDREISVTDPEGGVLSRTYDAAGNVASVTDQEGRTVETAYNSRNLPTTVTAIDFVDDPIAGSTPRDVVLASYGYDAAGRKTSETDAEGRTRLWVYDAADRVLSVTLDDYENPNQTTRDIVLQAFTYDDAGNPLTETTGGGLRLVTNTWDAAGRLLTSTLEMGALPDRVTTFDHDPSGNIESITLTDGTRTEETRFTYDTSDRAITQTVENGATDLTTGFGYDERGNRVSVTDPESNTTTTAFDEANRPTTVTFPQVYVEEGGGTPTLTQPTTTAGYNTFGDPTHLEDARGYVTTQGFDRLSRRTLITHPSYTDPDSNVITPTESFGYDDVGNLISQTSRRGHTTNFDFDDFNRVVRQLDPLLTGESTRGAIRFEYDDVGNRTAVVDQRGARVEYTYDDLNRVRTQTAIVRQPSGPDDEYTTTFDYDDLGNQTLVTDPNGDTTTFTWSAASEMLTATDPLSEVTSYTHDLAGRQTRVTDPLGRYTQWVFDQAGRQTFERRYAADDALLTERAWTYDDNGNPITATSPRGYTIEFDYDALNRLTEVTVPVTATTEIVTSYGYDAAGNTTRVTDGEANTTIYRYQEWGLQSEVEEPTTTQHPNLADRRWVTVFDAGGLPVEERQPGGVTVTRGFNQAGWLTSESGSGTGVTSASRSFGYDLAGYRTSASHPSGTIGFDYDDRGLLVETTGPAGSATFAYDPAGYMTQRIDGAGTTGFTWTDRGELATLSDPITGITISYAWDDASQLTTVTYGATNPPKRTLTWDDLGRLDTDTLEDASQATLVAFDYGYDDSGNVTSVDIDLGGNSLDGLHQYGYDHADRLTSWEDPSQTTITYTWDKAGNRTAAGSDSFTFDERNRLISSPDGTHTHTPRGTLDAIGSVDYDFDALGRLNSVDTVDYTWDALDRIATRESTAFTYSGPALDPTSDGTNTWSRTPGGRVVAQDDGTTTRLIGLNRHGDLSYLFTTGGSLTDSVVYDPFGDPKATTGTTGSPLGFQADYTDPTTTETWMGTRWYDAAYAAFTSRDTVFGELRTPITLNRYTYASANPLLYWDPDGRWGELIEGIGRTASTTTQGDLTGVYGSGASLPPQSTDADPRSAGDSVSESSGGFEIFDLFDHLQHAINVVVERGVWESRGRFVKRYGPADARYVGIIVPGVQLDWTISDLLRDTEQFYGLSDRLAPGDIAIYACYCYDIPQIQDAVAAWLELDAGRPYQDAEDLEVMIDWILALHQGEELTTVFGHSYGSTVTGAGLAKGDLADKIDQFAPLGSPGVIAHDAPDLRLSGDSVWALANWGDYVTGIPGWGPNPADLGFGAMVIQPTNTDTGLFTSHPLSQYLSNQALPLIAVGRGDEVAVRNYGDWFYNLETGRWT